MIDSIQVDSVDITLVEFQTNRGVIDVNPASVEFVLDESKEHHFKTERQSCVIHLASGKHQVVSHPRSEVLAKLQRLK